MVRPVRRAGIVTKTVREGNAFYEIDEECLRKREKLMSEEEKKRQDRKREAGKKGGA